MNDCLSFYIGVCDGCENIGSCSVYISANSKEGSELIERYAADVETAIAPVREKYKKEINSMRGGET